jgi:alkanesulfonate monooxygenase SsuD/methylene tetrahydromethanopterin reductase-like flavin-dependent oxidoreductase (luciferase family)
MRGFAISVPPHGSFADFDRLVDLAVAAERFGWDAFFLWDHVFFERGFREAVLDPWVVLGAIAHATCRIRLGTMVTPLSRRRPWKVARETLTLDRASNGRLVLGVGLGYPQDAEFGDLGDVADPRTRAERLDESLDYLRLAWSGEEFAFNGTHIRTAAASFAPRATHEGRIPVWVGGYWPNRRPFVRASKHDGVFPGRLRLSRRRAWTPDPYPLEDYRRIVEFIRSERRIDDDYAFAIGGYTDRGTDTELVHHYVKVGANWWIENLHEYRGGIEFAEKRIALGPPVLESRRPVPSGGQGA